MIVTITKVEQEFKKSAAECRKVTLLTVGNEITKLIFDNLKYKLELLQENATLTFKMVKKGQFWNVADISQVDSPPAREAKISPEAPKRQYGRDEDRVDQRTFVMEVGQDLRAKVIDKNHPFFKARETILASWVKLEVKEEKTKAVIDIHWLQDSVEKLWKTNRAFVQWVGDIYRVPMGGSVQDIINRLTIEQQEQLNNEIKSRLKLL